MGTKLFGCPSPFPVSFLAGLLVCALLLLCSPVPLQASPTALDFTTLRLGAGDQTVLIIGGIQGDEPGGFSAATLLATRYDIRKGSVWIVPNLNFPSIIQRSRGLHGDMNRKFADLAETDPEYATVRRIQELITAPSVRLVLNLHDGSGFYRERHEGALFNPKRWGQSVIIDQQALEGVSLGALEDEAQSVIRRVNARLVHPSHALHLHNTRTAEGDHEMERSLSYYAVRQGKAAFGLEASKEFPVELRVYYHLQMVEAFLSLAGVRFNRDFTLTPAGVRDALKSGIDVSFAENRIRLPLDDARPRINFLPLPKGGQGAALTSKPIMAVLPCRDNSSQLCIHYGNRTITQIRPEWREIDSSLSSMRVCVDGRDEAVPFGKILTVKKSVRIYPREGFRVNAIGVDRNIHDESNLDLTRTDFAERFSLDRQGTIFRVEVYKGQHFSGMFLLRFAGGKELRKKTPPILPDQPGKESRLGY